MKIDDELRDELAVVQVLDVEVLADDIKGYGEFDTIMRASDENGFEREYLAR